MKRYTELGTICVERLNVKGMMKDPCLAKPIAAALWWQLPQILVLKSAEAGRLFVIADRQDTTMMSGQREAIVEKDLCNSCFCHSMGIAGSVEIEERARWRGKLVWLIISQSGTCSGSSKSRYWQGNAFGTMRLVRRSSYSPRKRSTAAGEDAQASGSGQSIPQNEEENRVTGRNLWSTQEESVQRSPDE